MTALFWKDAHKLLEWPTGLTHFELDLDSIAVHQVTSKWSVMVRIIPIPALAALVIICKHPLKTFDVGLSYLLNKLLDVFRIYN